MPSYTILPAKKRAISIISPRPSITADAKVIRRTPPTVLRRFSGFGQAEGSDFTSSIGVPMFLVLGAGAVFVYILYRFSKRA